MKVKPAMKVRDIVIPKNGQVLRSGAAQYDCAIVARLDPFVLISEQGDMLWTNTVEKENFISHGEAPKEIWKNVKKRIKSSGVNKWKNEKL